MIVMVLKDQRLMFLPILILMKRTTFLQIFSPKLDLTKMMISFQVSLTEGREEPVKLTEEVLLDNLGDLEDLEVLEVSVVAIQCLKTIFLLQLVEEDFQVEYLNQLVVRQRQCKYFNN